MGEKQVNETNSKSQTLNEDNENLKDKLKTAERDFNKEVKEQENMYKEKMSKLEKVFETLNQRIEELQVKRKADTDRLESNEVKQLEAKLSKVENEKVQALKEKADLTGDLEMKKREVTKLISEKTAVESELQAMKDKKPEVAIDSENLVV